VSANIRLNQRTVRLFLYCNVVGVLVEVCEGIGDCRGREDVALLLIFENTG
jgi:hypothetical protein